MDLGALRVLSTLRFSKDLEGWFLVGRLGISPSYGINAGHYVEYTLIGY